MINRYQSLSIVVLFVSVSGPGLWSFSIPTRHWLWFFRLRLPVLFQQKVCILSESRSSWFNHVQFMSCCFLSALFRWLPYVAHGFSADVGPGELRNHVFLLRFFEWWIAGRAGGSSNARQLVPMCFCTRATWRACVLSPVRQLGPEESEDLFRSSQLLMDVDVHWCSFQGDKATFFTISLYQILHSQVDQLDEKYISNHQKQCETSINFPETPKRCSALSLFFVACLVRFNSIRFRTRKGHRHKMSLW